MIPLDEFVLGKHSGLSNINYFIEKNCLENISVEKAGKVLLEIKALAEKKEKGVKCVR